jgi:hypothetical protein
VCQDVCGPLVYSTVSVESLNQLESVLDLVIRDPSYVNSGVRAFELVFAPKRSQSQDAVWDRVSSIFSRCTRLEEFKSPRQWSAKFVGETLRTLNTSLVSLEIAVSFTDFDVIPMIHRFPDLQKLILAFGVAPRSTNEHEFPRLHLPRLRYIELVGGPSLRQHPHTERYLARTRLGPGCDVVISEFWPSLLKEVDHLFQMNATSSVTISGTAGISSGSSALSNTSRFSIDCMIPPRLFEGNNLPSIVCMKMFWTHDMTALVTIVNILRKTDRHDGMRLYVGVSTAPTEGRCQFHTKTFSSILWSHLKYHKRGLSKRSIEVYDHHGRSLSNEFRS